MRLLCALILSLAILNSPSYAQGWPNRVVHIIVPFGAGGLGDLLARMAADHLTTNLRSNEMEMSGRELIPAPRQVVWNALNDLQILKQCIPGCQSLEKTGDNEMTAAVKLKVGIVAATFNGEVRLTDIDAPHRYTIVGEGRGGVAGFAKGSANVSLAPEGKSTMLNYVCTTQVGGKIAQVGARLIDSTARKLAGQFFTRFNKLVSQSAHVIEGHIKP